MHSQVTAVVLHGADADLRWYILDHARRRPPIVDECEARRLAVAFCDGHYLACVRFLKGVVPERNSRAWQELMRAYEPTYEQLRDYLEHDCHVVPLLAARLALYYTRSAAA